MRQRSGWVHGGYGNAENIFPIVTKDLQREVDGLYETLETIINTSSTGETFMSFSTPPLKKRS